MVRMVEVKKILLISLVVLFGLYSIGGAAAKINLGIDNVNNYKNIFAGKLDPIIEALQKYTETDPDKP